VYLYCSYQGTDWWFKFSFQQNRRFFCGIALMPTIYQKSSSTILQKLFPFGNQTHGLLQSLQFDNFPILWHINNYKYRRFPSTGANQCLTLSRPRRAFENQSSIRGLASAEPQSHFPYPVPAVRQINGECPFFSAQKKGFRSFLKSWDPKSRSNNCAVWFLLVGSFAWPFHLQWPRKKQHPWHRTPSAAIDAAQNMKPRGQCPKPLITKGFTEKKELAILQWGCAYWIKHEPLVSWVQVFWYWFHLSSLQGKGILHS